MKRLFLFLLPLALAASGCSCRKAGTCEKDPDCTLQQRCCQGACKNILEDAANCGACGAVCSTVNAGATCAQGQCTLTCSAGFADCDKDAKTGCEASTATSTTNCGFCGTVCNYPNASPACSQGSCAIQSCNIGFTDCDKSGANGCEIETRIDVNNCGVCGKVCGGANGTPKCLNGVCRTTCNAGFGDCDGNTANGCETNHASSKDHCGMCNNPCADPMICSAGTCVSPDLLLFGGTNDLNSQSLPPLSNDVYKVSIDAKTFTLVTTGGTAPAARYAHMAAWDPDGKRMLVWGGFPASGQLDPTLYALDFGVDPPEWKTVTTTGTPPSARFLSAVGTDPAKKKWYVYGGSAQAGALSDFWAFDFATNTWSAISAGNPPPARDYPSGTFDSASNKFIMFGGTDAQDGTLFDDLWVCDLSAATPAWTQLNLSGGPAGRMGAALAGKTPTYLFGGYAFDMVTFMQTTYDETWSLGLGATNEWKSLTPTAKPRGRFWHSQLYTRNQLIIYGGGAVNASQQFDNLNDLWSYSPSANTWTELSANGATGAPGVAKVLSTLVARE